MRAAGILIVGIYLLSIIPATRPLMGELSRPCQTSSIKSCILLQMTGKSGKLISPWRTRALGRLMRFISTLMRCSPGSLPTASSRKRLTGSWRLTCRKGVIRIALERMAAGSVVEVLVKSDQNLSLSDIYFSVASKSGASQGRLPERRSDPPLGLRYIPPGGPTQTDC